MPHAYSTVIDAMPRCNPLFLVALVLSLLASSAADSQTNALPAVPDLSSIAAAQELPPVIPYWAFGHWIWEDERNTRAAVEELTAGYKAHKIPVQVVLIDSPWAKTFNDFDPNPSIYPDLPGMVKSLHDQGLRVLFFYTGALNSSSYQTNHGVCPTYDFALKSKYVINEGRESKWFKGPAIHVDFTKPEARAWWQTQLDKLHALGADGAKVDFAHNWFGKTVSTSQGLMSNRDFGYAYYKSNFDYNNSKNPEFVSLTYAWSNRGLMGFPGTCHVNWVGDFYGDWEGIKTQLKHIYLSAQHGFSGLGCEIGGYWKTASTKEQFIRYAQFACFVPIMINGGSLGPFDHHLPWKHDQETVEIYRNLVQQHLSLGPYLFSCSVEANQGRRNIIRDSSIPEESHLLGDQLFIKAITEERTKPVVITLPAGSGWIDFWDDTVRHAGNTRIEKSYSLSQYPVFIRAGAILPLGEKDPSLHIYPSGKSAYSFHRPLGSGIAYETIKIEVDEAAGTILLSSPREQEMHLLVKSFSAPTAVTGSSAWSYDAAKGMIRLRVLAGKNTRLSIEGLQGYGPPSPLR